MSEQSRDLTKEQIIQAASMAFSKFGFKKTTLDDIAALTNRGKTGIYYYFKNKNEIFKEVINKEADAIKHELSQILQVDVCNVEKFKLYVDTRMRAFEKLGSYYSAMRHELFEHLHFINRNRRNFDVAELEVIKKILKLGKQSGEFCVDNIEQVSQTILLTLKSLEIPFFGQDYQKNAKDMLETLVNLMLNGMVDKKMC
jgi:AcrR family transcriptional regulator